MTWWDIAFYGLMTVAMAVLVVRGVQFCRAALADAGDAICDGLGGDIPGPRAPEVDVQRLRDRGAL